MFVCKFIILFILHFEITSNVKLPHSVSYFVSGAPAASPLRPINATDQVENDLDRALVQFYPEFERIIFANVTSITLMVSRVGDSDRIINRIVDRLHKSYTIFNVNLVGNIDRCHDENGNTINIGKDVFTKAIKPPASFKGKALERWWFQQQMNKPKPFMFKSLLKRGQLKIADATSFANFKLVWQTFRYNGYIVQTSFANLRVSVDCFTHTPGTFLFIVDNSNASGVPLAWRTNTTAFDEITDIFNRTWLYNGVIKIYFLIDNELVTYDPFYRDPNDKSNQFGRIVAVSDAPALTFENMNGYLMRAEIFSSAFTIPIYNKKTKKISYFLGTDAEIISEMQRRMNFSVRIDEKDGDAFGFRLPNGSFTGALGRLISHQSDAALTGYFIKDYLTHDIDFTAPLYADSLCCVVPKAKRIPPSVLPLICFEPEVWLLIFVSCFLCGIVWSIMRRCSNVYIGVSKLKKIEKRYKNVDTATKRRAFAGENVHVDKVYGQLERYNLNYTLARSSERQQYVQIFVDSFILMLSAPMRRFSNVNSERIFILSICIISLIFVSMFQSSLATVFTTPKYYKDIKTLQELDESGLPIGLKYRAMQDDLFPLNSNPVIESLSRRIVLAQIGVSFMKKAATEGGIVAVTRKSSKDLDNALYFSMSKLFMVPECPRDYNLAYATTKHSVYLERMNSIILRLRNGGIINKWSDHMNFNMTMFNVIHYGVDTIAAFKVFTIFDLQLPFYMLLGGVITSTLIFIGEQCTKRAKRRKKKLNVK